MAPPRSRISNLGECLRAAREALHFDQSDLARRVFVSSRVVSRWENGGRPSPDQAVRIYKVLGSAPGPVLVRLIDALGLEVPSPAPVAPAVPPPPQPPTAADLRASLDAIILAAAEHRDVLPRHLRAFAVELLKGVDRLGIGAKEAALLVAPPQRVEGASEPSAS
jgi:transcriptional regulator with XRE-family HTH domain